MTDSSDTDAQTGVSHWLRAIDRAPHADDCMSQIVDVQTLEEDGSPRYRKTCNCWKADIS